MPASPLGTAIPRPAGGERKKKKTKLTRLQLSCRRTHGKREKKKIAGPSPRLFLSEARARGGKKKGRFRGRCKAHYLQAPTFLRSSPRSMLRSDGGRDERKKGKKTLPSLSPKPNGGGLQPMLWPGGDPTGAEGKRKKEKPSVAPRHHEPLR